MEKLTKNKAVIIFYLVMVIMTYCMMGRLEQLSMEDVKEYEVVVNIQR